MYLGGVYHRRCHPFVADWIIVSSTCQRHVHNRAFTQLYAVYHDFLSAQFNFSKMKTVTNYYILNLALADECFLIGIPFLIVTMIYGNLRKLIEWNVKSETQKYFYRRMDFREFSLQNLHDKHFHHTVLVISFSFNNVSWSLHCRWASNFNFLCFIKSEDEIRQWSYLSTE